MKRRFLSLLLTVCLAVGLVPMTAFAAEEDLTLDEDGYTSSYAVAFDGFEQRPALSELLAGIEGLTAEDIEIAGYGNNIDATAGGDLAYAEIRGINGVSGTSKIYFSIAPFNLSNATLLRTNANFNTESALDNLLAITSEDGTYVIPGGDIALRQVHSYSEVVDQGGGYPARCYYLSSSIMNLANNGYYTNKAADKRGDQTRYFIVSTSANYVQDDSSVQQGYWDYGTNRDNRNNTMNGIFNSLANTYFSCPDSMNITIDTFTAISQIDFSVNSPDYPNYDDGEIQWTVSSGTEGINVQKAVCNLIVNEDADNCKVTHQIDIYFTPAEEYIVADDATCAFLSQDAITQVDAATQWYKTSVIISRTNASHTWTDWQSDKEPTCIETGEHVRQCMTCGYEETEIIPVIAHDWGVWQGNGNGMHTHTCSVCGNTESQNCSGGTATCSQLAQCELCGSLYGDLDPDNHLAASEWTQENGKHYHRCAYGCDAHLDEADCSGGTATCTAPAICETCGNSYGAINPENHIGEIVWTKTATTHSSAYSCCNTPVVAEEAHEWQNGVCSECGYECQHTGGTATCTDKAVCDICGEEYGEVNAARHTNLVKTEAKPATHMTEGNIEYRYCDGCGKYFSNEAGTEKISLEDTVIPKLTEHTADETGWHSDETNHWNTCECGEKLNETAHTFEWVTDQKATATEAGSKHEECTVCGYEKAAVEIPATGTTEDPSEPPTDTDKPSGDQTGDTTSPQTGDDSNIALWMALMLAAGAVLTGTAVYSRKRKYSR